MGLRWTDTIDIAIELSEAHPEVDPQWIRFTDLHAWVCALPEFQDDPAKSTEGLLEGIQMAWIDEVREVLYRKISFFTYEKLILADYLGIIRQNFLVKLT